MTSGAAVQPLLFAGLAPEVAYPEPPSRRVTCSCCGRSFLRQPGRPRREPLCPRCLQHGESPERLRTLATIAWGRIVDSRSPRPRRREDRAAVAAFREALSRRDSARIRSLASAMVPLCRPLLWRLAGNRMRHRAADSLRAAIVAAVCFAADKLERRAEPEFECATS